MGVEEDFAKLVKYVRDFGTSHFHGLVLGYVESANEEFRMGKTHGVNDSIDIFRDTIDEFEGRNPTKDELLPLINLVKDMDFQKMDDEELMHSVEEVTKKVKIESE